MPNLCSLSHSHMFFSPFLSSVLLTLPCSFHNFPLTPWSTLNLCLSLLVMSYLLGISGFCWRIPCVAIFSVTREMCLFSWPLLAVFASIHCAVTRWFAIITFADRGEAVRWHHMRHSYAVCIFQHTDSSAAMRIDKWLQMVWIWGMNNGRECILTMPNWDKSLAIQFT